MQSDIPIPSENDVRADSNLGAIVLCGGKSSRMGVDKTQLLFQGTTLLQRVVSQVSQAVSQVVVVSNLESSPLQLASDVLFDRDQRAGCGGIEGMRVGLKRLAPIVDYAFVTSCDVPLLNPDLIRYLFRQMGDHQAVVPVDGRRVYGMAAIYRTNLHTAMDQRIDAGQCRVADLADVFDTHKIDVSELRTIDPELDSLTNINTGRDYLALLKRFGFECPVEIAGKLLDG